MLDSTSLADARQQFSSPRQQTGIYLKSDADSGNTESSSWQSDLEAFHSDGGALEVEE